MASDTDTASLLAELRRHGRSGRERRRDDGNDAAVNKMSHILRLADEYQAEGVHDCCGKALRDLSKSKENVVQIFSLATQTATARGDSRLDNVRFQCRQIVKDMELGDIQGSSGLKNLNAEASVSLLGDRIGRLETFVRQIYPQFIGLVEYSLCLGLLKFPGFERCRVHFGPDCIPGWKQVQSVEVNTGLPERIDECSVCRQMILEMVELSHRLSLPPETPHLALEPQGHVYGREYHFDSDVIPIVNDFKKVMCSLAPISCVRRSDRP